MFTLSGQLKSTVRKISQRTYSVLRNRSNDCTVEKRIEARSSGGTTDSIIEGSRFRVYGDQCKDDAISRSEMLQDIKERPGERLLRACPVECDRSCHVVNVKP